jgi:hypothetical protein
MASWAIFTWFLARGPFARGQRWAWECLATGICVWFVVDSTASARAGVWMNVVGNLVFAGLYLIPLAATWRSARPRPAQ